MSTTPHWLARTGVSLSLMATTLLTLTQWRTWSGLAEAGYGLVLCAGAGVALGVLWTLAQATIHTRLGSQPMFPERPQTAAPLSAPQVLGWIGSVTGLLLLGHLAGEWSFIVNVIHENTGSVGHTAMIVLESILLLHLWPRLVLGIGLGFGAALLAHRIRPVDRMATARARSATTCQAAPVAEAVRIRLPKSSA